MNRHVWSVLMYRNLHPRCCYPRHLGAPPSLKSTEKCRAWWLLSNLTYVHKIHFRPGLSPEPHWGSLRRSPEPVVKIGCWGPRGTFTPIFCLPCPLPSAFSASRSRRIWNEVVIGPRENGFRACRMLTNQQTRRITIPPSGRNQTTITITATWSSLQTNHWCRHCSPVFTFNSTSHVTSRKNARRAQSPPGARNATAMLIACSRPTGRLPASTVVGWMTVNTRTFVLTKFYSALCMRHSGIRRFSLDLRTACYLKKIRPIRKRLPLSYRARRDLSNGIKSQNRRSRSF